MNCWLIESKRLSIVSGISSLFSSTGYSGMRTPASKQDPIKYFTACDFQWDSILSLSLGLRLNNLNMSNNVEYFGKYYVTQIFAQPQSYTQPRCWKKIHWIIIYPSNAWVDTVSAWNWCFFQDNRKNDILYILCSLLSDERDYVSDTIGIHSQSSPPRLEDTPHSYKWVPHQSHFLPRYIMCLHSDHARAGDPVTIIQEKVYNHRHFKSAKQRRHQTGNILNCVGSELFSWLHQT